MRMQFCLLAAEYATRSGNQSLSKAAPEGALPGVLDSSTRRLLQAANILMGEDGSCMLADFGVAATTHRGASAVNLAHEMASVMHRTFVGTPCWLARMSSCSRHL